MRLRIVHDFTRWTGVGQLRIQKRRNCHDMAHRIGKAGSEGYKMIMERLLGLGNAGTLRRFWNRYPYQKAQTGMKQELWVCTEGAAAYIAQCRFALERVHASGAEHHQC